MNLKKTAQDAKIKIYEHRFEILTVVSTSMSLALSAALIITKDKLDKSYLDNVETLKCDRFPAGGTTYLATNVPLEPVSNTSAPELNYEIHGHTFNIVYDPEC